MLCIYTGQGDSILRRGKKGRMKNFGGGGGGYYGAGGGYGSRGTTPTSDARAWLKIGEGGRSYGDRLVHVQAYMGSGGGSGGGRFMFTRGGNGGGVLSIIAGCIHNKGRITALGQRGRYLAGSGAGGSIIIDCNAYFHYGKGAILAASLEPYPDVEKKRSGGIGGCGRVAIRINRQKWTSESKKAICTNDVTKIWNPAPWIYPMPKWLPKDQQNEQGRLRPKLIGFHKMEKYNNKVYKNSKLWREEGEADGPLSNKFIHYGHREHREVQMYTERKEKEREALWNWKFEEFAINNQQQQQQWKQQGGYVPHGNKQQYEKRIAQQQEQQKQFQQHKQEQQKVMKKRKKKPVPIPAPK